jgi:hypothetical protein
MLLITFQEAVLSLYIARFLGGEPGKDCINNE